MRYTIQDSTEETYCDHCGQPLLAGDCAVMSDDESLVTCDASCMAAVKFTLSHSPDAFQFMKRNPQIA